MAQRASAVGRKVFIVARGYGDAAIRADLLEKADIHALYRAAVPFALEKVVREAEE